MEWFYYLVEAAASFIEAFLVISVIEAFAYSKRYGRHTAILKVAASIIVVAAVLYMNYTWSLFSYITLAVCISLEVIFGKLLFKIEALKGYAIGIIYFTISGAFAFFIMAIVELMGGVMHFTTTTLFQPGMSRVIIVLAVKLLEITAFLIFKRLKKDENRKTKTSSVLLICIVGAVCFWCMDLLTNALTSPYLKEVRNAVIIAWIFMILFVVGGIIALNTITKQNQKKQEYQLIGIQNSMLEQNYKKINELYKNNARNFHDFKNHVISIDSLLKQGEYEKLRQYVDQLGGSTYNSKIVFYTGVDIVDAVLNNKEQEAKDNDIKIKIQAIFPVKSNIQSVDICAILANLMDNALEACKKIPEKEKRFINVKINCVSNLIIIVIENAVHEKQVKVNGSFITSKSNKDLHGFGLRSVKSSIEKYDGTIKQDCDDYTFHTKVSLYFE